MRKLYLLFSFCLMIIASSTSMAQTNTIIIGVVRDDTGQPVPGVNVLVKGTTNGTSTDSEGKYSLSVPDSEVTLIFSFIGYTNQEVPAAGRSSLDVTLMPDVTTLNEVLVVGYGSQERKDVTGAIATVKSESIKDLPLTSADQKLAGQIAGVQVNQATGTPGGGVVIRVRGSGSIGAGDDPLYVIDGFPVTNSYSRSSNPLSAINPDDIESITVLKDASSTAIYGSRGSNGVILVNTKKAKSGQSSIEFSSYVGLQSVSDRSKIKMMTAEEFANYQVESLQDLAAFQNKPFDSNTVPVDYRNPASLGKGTNWFDEVTRTAPMQNYNLTISKGTENVKTLFSAGYFNQQGTVENTGFKRYSLRSNIEFTPRKALTLGLNLNPSYTERKLANTEGHFNDATLTQSLLNSPLVPAYQPDGSYTTAIVSGDPSNPSNPLNTFSNANPLSILNQTKNVSNEVRILANTFIDIEPIKGLHLKSTFNIDQRSGKSDYFKPSYVGAFRNPPLTPVSSPAIGTYINSSLLNWLNENTVTYDKNFGNHHISVLVGYTVQQERFESTTNFGSQYANDAIQTISGATTVTASSDIQKWRLQSYLARVNYAFSDKYLFAATVRRDGSSRFAPSNRWSAFPSVSAGWRISEEAFFSQNKWVNDLKLRASYGLAGNNNIGNYAYSSIVTPDNYTFGGSIANGAAQNSLANNILGWETSRQMDIGIDASIINGRIVLIAEYYRRNTEDMLQLIAVPAASGYTRAQTNLGNVLNHGIELTLGTKNTTGALAWETDFNISFNRNKVLDLGSNAQILSGQETTNISKVGSPMGMFYGYKFLGLFQTQAELDSSPKQVGQTALGTVKYEDFNGNGIIDAGDKQPIGNAFPNFTFGMTNRLRYLNFDLSILINGSQGAKIMDLYKRFTTNIDGQVNVEADVKNRWRSPAQPGNGSIATTVASTPLAREINSSWVKDASYLTIRNITLGYHFKAKFVENIRVYASVQNAFLFSPYKNGWPEINFNGNNSLAPGVNYTGYPVPVTYTLGANFRL